MAGENADVKPSWSAQTAATRILQTELSRAGIALPGPKALPVTDLTRPVIDLVALARGFGVPTCRVGTDSELAAQPLSPVPGRDAEPGLFPFEQFPVKNSTAQRRPHCTSSRPDAAL